MNTTTMSFKIQQLGSCEIPSPLSLSSKDHDFVADYVDDTQSILSDIQYSTTSLNHSHHLQLMIPENNLMQLAGPRKNIYHNPENSKAAIVTCGGLCPGLNSVVRALVMNLWHAYGVHNILGIRFGYRGLLPEFGFTPMQLDPERVADIHRQGGTILGSSRGHGNRTAELVDTLQRENINMLFTIGGDGTQNSAWQIAKECERRAFKCSIVGIPKTIDNDISFVERSFGFDTAVSLAVNAVASAHTEAHDAIAGIGIVKVMGRQSGFIAAHTTLATNDVNYVLIPEVPFVLEGENGLIAHIERRIKRRNHAVILVAEGAGEKLLGSTGEKDASGNPVISDIGPFLVQKIKEHFAKSKTEVNIKYIDPSYIIRAAPANPNDSIYCTRLAVNAVHAAMAGKTGCLVSFWNGQFVYIPTSVAIVQKNLVDPEGSLWRDVVSATGQPLFMC